ncbi:MAG: lipopolysaccharide assembly protein LapA domain-containing protein [Acidobacteriota bacterium]
MRFVILILVVALLASLGTYTVLNINERVDINTPWSTWLGVPQIYLVLASLAAGVVFIGLMSVIDGTRLRLSNRRLRREIRHLRDLPNRRPEEHPAGSLAEGGLIPREPAASGSRELPDRPVIPPSEGQGPYGV